MKHPSSPLALALMGIALAVLTFAAIAGAPAPAVAGDYISEKPAAGSFQLVHQQAAADIFVADDDWKVARIAAGDLALDVERVTGRRPALKHAAAGLSAHAVLVGTIGRSRVLDRRIEAGWADVTPKHCEAIHVSPERLRVGPPGVKYRGIFINDEMWGIRPWAAKNFAPDEGLGLGPKTYARIFELLLRLRANHLWPAMHQQTTPFNCYPQNKIVADIKPGEIGTEFFLDLAWDPQRYRHDNLRDFLVRWAAWDLDPRFAGQIAGIMEEYYRLGLARRPEHLVQARSKAPLQYSWFSHTQYNDEAMQRLDEYDAIARRAQAIYEQLPTARKDAFFELVLYPVQCSTLMNRKILFADKSLRHGIERRACASEDAAKARATAARIIELTTQYNRGLLTAGDKWNDMMTWAPGPWGAQRHQFEMPPLSDYDGAGPPTLGVALEGGNAATLADLSVYTQGKRFVDLYNTGKGDIRWTAAPSQAWVQLNLTSGNFATERRLWVSIDWNRAPAGDVLANLRRLTATVKIASPGQHTLTVWMVGPGVVLDKLVPDFAPPKDSFLGPPESYRR